MNPIVRVTNLTKTESGQARALTGVNLSVYRGQVTVLIGPPGSGKTTLLSILGGILRPTSGSVQVAGQEISQLSENELLMLRQLNFGFLFPGSNLNPMLTAAENVEVALRLKGIKGRASQLAARELLDLAGLSDHYDTLPTAMSGGQQQGVAIARALAGSPKMVLADEPTASLDDSSRRYVMAKLAELARSGYAVVVASSDKRTMEYADRVIEIANGRIASDSADTILPEPYKENGGNGKPVDTKLAIAPGDPSSSVPVVLAPPDPLRRWLILAVVLLLPPAVWGLLHLSSSGGASSTASAPRVVNPTRALVGAAGKVEPASTEIKIGASISGRLLQVAVDEGETVKAGQLLARIDPGELGSRVAQANAMVKIREAELDRVTNGSSSYERQTAEASVAEAQVILDNARADMQQRQAMLQRGEIQQIEFDRASRQVRLAQAGLDKARANAAMIVSPAREEERARASANLQAAQARLQEAQALFEKAFVRAPFDGVVLRVYHSAGEDVAPGGGPIVSFGDLSRLRVRVDVDEADVARIHLGDKAYVTAQAYGDTKFTGTVSQISGQLGRKNIDTGDPEERIDTRVLETLVDLDSGVSLPVGLRVDAFITSAP